MKPQLYISKGHDGLVQLMAPFVSEDGKTTGSYASLVGPGQISFGRTYEEWLNGPDSVDIDSLPDISPKNKSTK